MLRTVVATYKSMDRGVYRLSQPDRPTSDQPPGDGVVEQDLPEGNHPLEIAARTGFGPLSPLVQEVWHGHATPCVSCGQLVQRGARKCEHCGQNLTPRMVEKMRLHAGPWFVLEHLHPFPGVTLDRIIRQIRRGLLTEASIVRGPATDFQWRFAVEIPGLCRYFGRCWDCHGLVAPSDSYCPGCLRYLTFEKPAAPAGTPAFEETPNTSKRNPEREQATSNMDRGRSPSNTEARSNRGEGLGTTLDAPGAREMGGAQTGTVVTRQPTCVTPQPARRLRRDDLDMLRAALEEAPAPKHDTADEGPPLILGIRATWIAGVLLTAAVLTLLVVARNRSHPSQAPTTPMPQFVQPTPQDAP